MHLCKFRFAIRFSRTACTGKGKVNGPHHRWVTTRTAFTTSTMFAQRHDRRSCFVMRARHVSGTTALATGSGDFNTAIEEINAMTTDDTKLRAQPLAMKAAAKKAAPKKAAAKA